MTKFFKKNPTDKIWWVDYEGKYIGREDFSFDRKTIYSFWQDYPDNLTPAQKAIFDRENKWWVEYFGYKTK